MTPEQQAERTKAITLLRTPSSWPEGFEWSFVLPSTCAIGLFRKAGLLDYHNFYSAQDYFEAALGLTYRQWCNIFSIVHKDIRGLSHAREVTPEHVAMALEDPEHF
jgi:hypothetical protein